MQKRQRYRKLENHHAEIDQTTGKPRRTVVTIPQENDDRQLIIENCSNLIIRGAAVKGWQGAGDVMNGKPYAIDVRGGCDALQIEKPTIIGAPNEITKQGWRTSANNGLIVRAENTNTKIIDPSISGVHYGIDLRGAGGLVEGGAVAKVSADNLCGRGDGWTIDNVTLNQSLEIVSYDELHRDLIQIYEDRGTDKSSPAFLNDWLIKNCRLGLASALHPFEKPGQIFLFSDGIGRNIRFIDNEIITEHDLAIVMSVCIGAEIRGNKIWTKGQCRPQVRVIPQRYGVKSESIIIEDNPICQLDGELAVNTTSRTGSKDFMSFMDSLRNKKAPAITEEDYRAASLRLGLGTLMIKAVFKVESGQDGYLSDGSLKTLLERHWVYKLAAKAKPSAIHGALLKAIENSPGAKNCNKTPGGYKGDKAEYFRASTVADCGHPDALEVVLQSMSWGKPQIMGFNHKKAGYDSALEMVIDLHKSEANHLNAFCNFLEAEGQVKYLQEAEKNMAANKLPGKALTTFAELYNGPKHKQYDLKIARAYRLLADAEADVVIPDKRKSSTLQGTALATVGNTGSGVSIAVLLNELRTARETAEATTTQIQTELDAIKGQASEPNYLLWTILGFVLLSQSGVIISGLARLRARIAGRNP